MASLDTAQAFVARFVLPLLNGGEVRPLAPLGPRQARELCAAADSVEGFESVQSLRLRAARRLCALDSLPSQWSEAECLLLVALNDLLQLTNPWLCRGVRSASNYAMLSALICELVERAGPPRTLAEVLSRHTLVYGATRLERHDTRVAWWTGSRDYIGERPPPRIIAWPSLRRVSTTLQRVALDEMGETLASFDALRDSWLAASPLTFFWALGEGRQRFFWTGSTLSLVALPQGRSLAMRALLGGTQANAGLDRLRKTCGELEHDPEAHELALDFVHELAHRQRQLEVFGA